MIKAYPLIDTRIKNVDFPSNFYVQPKDLDSTKAKKIVAAAMKGLAENSDIRYLVFSLDKYMIFGIAGFTRKIAEVVGDASKYSQYLSDKFGRPTKAFIGYAVDKTDITNSSVPDVSMDTYFDMYIEYLTKQWEEPIIKTEYLSSPVCELESSERIGATPTIVEVSGRRFIEKEYFYAHKEEIISYYFNKIVSDSTISFLSGIDKDYNMNDIISDISVSQDIINSYKNKKIDQEQDSFASSSSSKSDSPKSMLGSFNEKFKDIGKSPKPQDQPYEKKTPNSGSRNKTIGIAIGAIILIMIIIVRNPIGTFIGIVAAVILALILMMFRKK